MTNYHYSDIPDDMITKEYFPIGRHLWRVFSELGPRFLMKWHMKYTNSINELMKERLDSAIKIGQAFREDKIEDPKKTLSFQFFPTLSMVRCDLQSGAMKRLFNESADCSFVMVDDTLQEIFYLINTHIEEGLPTNWWIIMREDEILNNTRHKKLGFKIRDLPRKLKDLKKVGLELIDVLKDIRNERNPEYTQSSLQVIVAYASNVANLVLELSSYEGFNALWEGLQLKSKYPQLKDNYAAYNPTPTFLRTLLYRRNEFTLQTNKLVLDSKLALHTIENKWQNFINDELPELWEIGLIRQLEEGIPTPQLSLQSKTPDIGNPEIIKAEKFDFIYPEGERITPEGLELTIEEIFSGVYLNVTPETPIDEKITKGHIISTGIGKETKIY